ncbi:MAG: lamin tail domain-containing protein, partial [Patescibacteria group bacterium]
VINEFLPNSSQEWVEFYNSGTSTEDLSNYYFDDDTNFGSDSGSSAKVALFGLLQSLATCYLDLNTFLNNNGDSPTLFLIDGAIKDTYIYSSTLSDKSYSRMPDGGNWQTNVDPTKSVVKCSDSAPTPPPTPTPNPTQTPTPKTTPSPTTKPTSTPLKTLTPTPSPTSAKVPSQSPATVSTNKPEVIGISISEGAETPPPSPISEPPAKKSFPFGPIILILLGLIFLGISIYTFWRNTGNREEIKIY